MDHTNQHNMEDIEDEEFATVNPDDVLQEVEFDDNQDAAMDEDDDSDTDTDTTEANQELIQVNDMSEAHFSLHKEPVYCVAIHPTQQHVVATGSGDEKAYVWSMQNRTVPATQPASSSNDGSAAEPAKAEIQPTYTLSGHKDSIIDLAFNFDGTLLATGSMDATVKVWNFQTGQLVSTLEGPSDAIEWLQWHPRGNVVLAGSADTTCWLWASNGQCLNVLAGHGASVTCGGFTCDGKLIVTGSEDGSVRVWNPKNGATQCLFSGPSFTEAGVTTLKTHPTEPNIILSGSQDGSAQLVHISQNKILGIMKGHDQAIESVGFAPNFPVFATGGVDGKICLWDSNTLQLRQNCQHSEAIVKLMFDPQRPLLYSCSVDATIAVWDVRTGSQVKSLTGHTNVVLDFDVTRDGSTLVSGSDDWKALLFKL